MPDMNDITPTQMRGAFDRGELPFIKMHGLGNDFVVIDLRDRDGVMIDTASARSIADRHRGVGCDQLITLEPPHDGSADIFMRINNADGGEVAACGNATRCVGQLMFDELGRDQVTIETGAGLLDVRRVENAGGPPLVQVDMGPVLCEWNDVPLANAVDTLQVQLEAPDMTEGLEPFVCLNVGNPHAVLFVDDVAAFDLATWGPRLEHHTMFPERANISVAEITGPSEIRSRTWERGVGITLACGTAACAVGAAAVRRDLAPRSVTVRVDGGTMQITWKSDNHVLMTGPSETSFVGRISPALFIDVQNAE
jgi:diaminopimelate epimerase